MKIYLAARYSRHPEMRIVRTHLEGMGYEVTSRWINGGHELTKEGSTEAHEAERLRYAEEDVADLRAADIVISFTEEPRKITTRGGRHVEFGMALALGKSVYVVGWRENVFHTLPTVRFFKTTRECLLALQNPPGGDAVLAASGPNQKRGTAMNEAQIKHMVDRFLQWRLPDPWHPDGGISFEAEYNKGTPYVGKYEPVGTNLFCYTEAEAMVRHMLEGLPTDAVLAAPMAATKKVGE